jgi:hypothetical protein
MRDTTSTLEYYRDLLLYEYIAQPKARAHVGALVGAALCDFVALDVQDGFDVETAVGPQLDVIGEYVGFNRNVQAVIQRTWFGVQDYTTYNPAVPAVGFTDYTDATVNASSVWYRYEFVSQSTIALTDDEYRYLLKLKIQLNACNMSTAAITKIIWDFFGTDIVLTDNKNMTIGYHLAAGASYLATMAVSQNMIPKPMGVALVVV